MPRGATLCAETRAKVCVALRTAEEQARMALKRRLVRVALAGIGLVLGVDSRDRVRLAEACGPSGRSAPPPSAAGPAGTQVRRDAMWNVIARKPARETDEAGESCARGRRRGGKGAGSALPPRVGG